MKFFYCIFFLLVGIVGGQAQSDISNNCKGKKYDIAEDWKQKGQQLLQQKKTKEGIAKLYKARQLYLELDCENKTGKMELNILKGYLELKQNKKLTTVYRLFSQRLNPPLNALQQRTKGRLDYLYSRFLLKQNKAKQSLAIGEKSIALLEQSEDWVYYQRTAKHLGLVAYHLQDFLAMEYFVDRAYYCNKKHLENNKRNIKGIMQLYGALYYKTGNYKQALEKTKNSLEEALKTMNSRNDTNCVVELYNNMALYYIVIGDVYKAEDYCKNALQLSKKIKNYYEVSTIYLNMGELFYKQEELDKAFFYYNQANRTLEKAVITTAQRYKSTVNIHNNIAAIAIKTKRYNVALDALQKNLLIHKKEPYHEEATYFVFGKYYRSIRQYKTAKKYFEKALEKGQLIYGTKHPLVAKIYFELGLIAQKEFEDKRVLKLFEAAQIALSMPLDISNKPQISDKKIWIKIQVAKATYFLEKEKLELAFEAIQNAVEVLEELRVGFQEEGSKLFLVKTMIPTYELAIDLSYQLHQKTAQKQYLETAFSLIENSKSMLLLDALKTENARNFGGVPQPLLDQERQLKRELAKYEKQLFEAKLFRKKIEVNFCQKQILKLKRASEKLEKKLEETYPKYYQLKYNTTTIALAAVQDELDEQTALVEYFVGNNSIYIFTIYKDTTWLTAMPVNLLFTNSIRALRSSLTQVEVLRKDPRNSFLLMAKNARNIYQKYLEPALKTTPAKRLIIIPDGLLNYLPFDVLLTQKPDYNNKKFEDLPYLIKTTTINYHYSATLMLFNKDKAKPQKGLKMLGMASTYEPKKFQGNYMPKGMRGVDKKLRAVLEPLPSVLTEVEDLSQIFQGDFYIGQQANERHFKEILQQNHYSVIHLAMHGLVDDNKPEYSSLAFTFSQDSVEDDFLHAYELSVLDLDAELVVLSACKTGFGRYERGEGVVSLGRGFMYAGAPSLVMTLWSINDKAAYILIKDFYQYLAKGYPKDEALRLAKLDYIKEYSSLLAHPFFWASFISVGDARPIQLATKKTAWDYALYGFSFFGLLALGLYFFKKK